MQNMGHSQDQLAVNLRQKLVKLGENAYFSSHRDIKQPIPLGSLL